MIKPEFLVERQGKRFVLYAGLLDAAHGQGLKSIRTQLIQAPSSENNHTAICSAEVTTDRGTFTGLGDASPDNVSRMMAPHLIRMAETRAKARALRDSINVGVTAFEELGDAEDQLDQADRHARPAAEPPRATEPARVAEVPRAFAAAVPEPPSRAPVEPPRQQAPAAPEVPARVRPLPARAASVSATPPSVPSSAPASPPQLQAIFRIGKDQQGLTDQQLDARARELFGVGPAELTQSQAADLIRQLQASRGQHSDSTATTAPASASQDRGRPQA